MNSRYVVVEIPPEVSDQDAERIVAEVFGAVHAADVGGVTVYRRDGELGEGS